MITSRSRVRIKKMNHKGFYNGDECRRQVPTWWQTCLGYAQDSAAWDDEVDLLNETLGKLGGLPAWAYEIRDNMPRYGFEMCAHRWTEGLDNLNRALAAQHAQPCQAGRCGDIPGRQRYQADLRAEAALGWSKGKGSRTPTEAKIFARLGARDEAKAEAARAYAEMVRAFLFAGEDGARAEVCRRWEERAQDNRIMEALLDGGNWRIFLENACGYRLVPRLDSYLRLIGGDGGPEDERQATCNWGLRYVLRDDPARYEVARGYLWGWQAYLLGEGEEWLRREHPYCAGPAVSVLRQLEGIDTSTSLIRWLVASALKTTKLWCEYVLAHASTPVPERAADLPQLAHSFT